MAKEVLKDAHVTINSVDLSDHVESLSLPLSTAEIDKTSMGDSSVARLAGLNDCTLTVTFRQDFDASKVDVTLFAIRTAGVAVPIVVRKSDTLAKSATNPEYTFNAIMTEYTPIDGTVGDISSASVTFMCDGDVTREV